MDGEAVGEGPMGEGPVCQCCEEMRELGGGEGGGVGEDGGVGVW